MSKNNNVKGGYGGVIEDIIISGLLPYVAYRLLKSNTCLTDLQILGIVTVFPMAGSIKNLLTKRSIDIISILAFLGIGVSAIAVVLGGDPKLLLIRESLLTGALGAAAFISLMLPRPLMYYFARASMNKTDAAEYEKKFSLYPGMRKVMRNITVVWAIAFTGEFLTKVALVYSLQVSTVLAVSPFFSYGITLGTLTWTFAYVKKAKSRVAELHVDVPPDPALPKVSESNVP